MITCPVLHSGPARRFRARLARAGMDHELEALRQTVAQMAAAGGTAETIVARFVKQAEIDGIDTLDQAFADFIAALRALAIGERSRLAN